MKTQAKASSEQIILHGKIRVTLLTSRFFRIEWADDRVFEDRRTFSVVNRKLKAPIFEATVQGHKLTIDTGDVKLTLIDDGKTLDSKNCYASFEMNGKWVKWHATQIDSQNLGATVQTLDGINGDSIKKYVAKEKADPKKPILHTAANGHVYQGEEEKISLGSGFLSKSGWAVVDDSHEVVLDPKLCDWQDWVCARPEGERQDLYLLTYGLDFKACLKDASQVFGSQPLPPRYALGYWYSRYWAYTDKEIESLIQQHDRMGVPLDVMVIDMDWHKMGWTGYTWDSDYFPDHREMLQWLRQQGIKTTLNLHPASGVFSFEDQYPKMLEAMNIEEKDLPPLEDEYKPLFEKLGIPASKAANIPLNICDPNYMKAYFEQLHHPLENEGVDFWWMDWQQGNQGSQIKNLQTLPWINEIHWHDQKRKNPNQRPINFSRYGGIGAGRMPVGFSGDTVCTWESLAFQPRLTATASNVLYGTWSHDIGGHYGGEDRNPELYTRWLQYGMLSPVLRTHTSKDARKERRIFEYAEPHKSIMIETLRRRYELAPYIYGAMRKAEETGISLCRPMYYDYPKVKEAYQYLNQYMLGDDLLVAPITEAGNEATEMANAKVWLPEGEWIDLATGKKYKGHGIIKTQYLLGEVPMFVRLGTIICGQMNAMRLKEGSYDHLLFEITAGASGQSELYEDDGISLDYQKGSSVSLAVNYQESPKVSRVKLTAAKGKYKGFRTQRPVTLRIFSSAPPISVTLDGQTLEWNFRGGPQTWSYNGDQACVVVECGEINLTKSHEIVLSGPRIAHQQLDGFKGWMNGLENIRFLNCLVSPCHPIIAEERFAVHLAQTGNRISRNPVSIGDELKNFYEGLGQLPAILKKYQKAYEKRQSNINALTSSQVTYLSKASLILKALNKRN